MHVEGFNIEKVTSKHHQATNEDEKLILDIWLCKGSVYKWRACDGITPDGEPNEIGWGTTPRNAVIDADANMKAREAGFDLSWIQNVRQLAEDVARLAAEDSSP